MPAPIPSPGVLRLLRHAIRPQTAQNHNQVRHATLIKRPKRPYTFTQLVTLSDGSTFIHRTTSPSPVYRSTKDQRNTPLWNPSSQKLLNVEEDEAGKLKAFREKFGRGWDAEVTVDEDAEPEGQPKETKQDMLLDLISDYGKLAEDTPQARAMKQAPSKTPKKGGKK